MLNKLLSKIPKSIWGILAVLIVMMISGPEILLSMELFALIELLGVETFVLMYASGLFLQLSPLKTVLDFVVRLIYKLEKHSSFCILSKSTISQYPMSLMFLFPVVTSCYIMEGGLLVGLTLQIKSIVLTVEMLDSPYGLGCLLRSRLLDYTFRQ